MARKKIAQPRKIKIGENKYDVKTRKYKSWSKKKTGRFGQITTGGKTKLIELRKDQTGDRMFSNPEIAKLDTVIHEILHGIVAEYDVGVDGRKEERWVSLIANGLTDVLNKNPKLVEWLSQQAQKD